MQTESIELSILSLFAPISFFIFLICQKISSKESLSFFLDHDFSKPQAFHGEPIARIGGLASLISLIIFFILYYLIFEKILYDYLFVSLTLFLIGLLDDIKISINPKTRLILMIIFLIFFISYFSIDILRVDLNFLNNWLENRFFQLSFILLCFLFVINGSNLIDGFNGLISIHLLIINALLLFINLIYGNMELSVFITAQIIILFSFLLFNFPKAKMFLGDGGAYLFGALIALNVIKTNNLIPEITSFFFCIILFYLFFEVFFSFFRKIFEKKNPLKPDDNHLHMLLFKKLNKKVEAKKANFLTSLILNSYYAVLILPSIFFTENGFICRYLFLTLLFIYILTYYYFRKDSFINNEKI